MRISDWSSDVCSSDLFCLRLLDLDDHFRLLKNDRCRGHDFRACAAIIFIAGADAVPRPTFDKSMMAMRSQFMNAFGRSPDAILVVLDLPDSSNNHLALLLLSGAVLQAFILCCTGTLHQIGRAHVRTPVTYSPI